MSLGLFVRRCVSVLHECILAGAGRRDNSTHQSREAPSDLNFYRPVFELLWRCFGQDRLIYGSNWPVCDHAHYKRDRSYDSIEPSLIYRQQFELADAFIREKGGEVAARKLFAENARAAYKWVDRIDSG